LFAFDLVDGCPFFLTYLLRVLYFVSPGISIALGGNCKLIIMKTPISMNSITVGITDCARYANYERWFLDAPIKVNVIRLSYNLNNHDDIEKCQGIVLSGGEDVDPRRYKRPDLLGRLEFTDIDEKRDEFEWEVIRRALKLQLPILGICRG